MREAAERLAMWKSMSYEEKLEHKSAIEAVERLERNGITMDDLADNYNRGVDAGYKHGTEQTFETLFAAICLAVEELYGFDGDKCVELLNCVHDKVYYALTAQDVIQEVFERLGLTINFKDNAPGEVVEKTGDEA